MVIFERATDQLAHLGDGLDAREAGSNHHEAQQLLLDRGIFRHVRRLQTADHVGAQAVRVGEVLHGQRVLGQSGEALQIDAGAERDDELVVIEIHRDAARALHDDHLLLVEVDAHDFGLTHLQPVQQLAERHHRVGGMDRGGGDLGQKRLKDEIVVGVDEFDLELAAATEPLERLGREYAPEAAADHQHFLFSHGLIVHEHAQPHSC